MVNAIWLTLAIIAIISLFIYRSTRNAVWGGLTGGVIIGFIIALIVSIGVESFSVYTIGKATIIGTLTGVVAELLGKVGDSMKK